MHWELKDQGVSRPDDLPDRIDRRLRFALARFGSRIQKTIVFLHDRNGPKGGIDKVCRILVKTHGCGTLVAAIVDSDWNTAVDRATARIGHTVSRQIARVRDRQVEQATRPFKVLRGLAEA
ncbi:MAG: HPF/RaiA family ribosome-associated protein [Planctomycetia bacterium]